MMLRFLVLAKNPVRWFVFMTLILAVGIAWIMFSSVPASATTNSSIPSPRPGFLAPDFSLEQLGGGEISLSNLRGQVVVLNIWASWCPPCRAEMPALQRVYESNQDRGLHVLGIHTTFQDREAAAIEFAMQQDISFPILLDRSGLVSRMYQMRALPTTFFIDRAGIIQEVVIGGRLNDVSLQTTVETLLGEVR
jgi:cytochrome c biogenesis protein CcmG/thiol:disulfide interchange protein DsbE